MKRKLDEHVQAIEADRGVKDHERLKGWTLHDIRRSVVTGMANDGVQPQVIEAVVNHISGHKAGIAGIYNRATYDCARRQALAGWSSKLVTGTSDADNVVPFDRRGGAA